MIEEPNLSAEKKSNIFYLNDKRREKAIKHIQEGQKKEGEESAIIYNAEKNLWGFSEFKKNFFMTLNILIKDLGDIFGQLEYHGLEGEKVRPIGKKRLEQRWDEKINFLRKRKARQISFEKILAELVERNIRPDLQERIKECSVIINIDDDIFIGSKKEILAKIKKFAEANKENN